MTLNGDMMKTLMISLIALLSLCGTSKAQVTVTKCCSPLATLDLFTACLTGGGPRRDFNIIPKIERELWDGEIILVPYNDAPKEYCSTGFLDTEYSLQLMEVMCQGEVSTDEEGMFCTEWGDPVPELICETHRDWVDCQKMFDIGMLGIHRYGQTIPTLMHYEDEHVDLLDYAALQNEFEWYSDQYGW